MAKYIIAHDFGTSANKASLFTTEGKFVKTATAEYPPIIPIKAGLSRIRGLVGGLLPNDQDADARHSQRGCAVCQL